MAGAHRALSVVSFVLSEVLEDVAKNESEDELRRHHLSYSQGAPREQYRLRHVLLTQVTAISARGNNSGRYRCFFNSFNPVLCGLTESSFLPIDHETTQQTQPT